MYTQKVALLLCLFLSSCATKMTPVPLYVAMAAPFAQAYRPNQPRPSDTIRLALFDEAFSRMDTACTASALRFIREAGLQAPLATSPHEYGSLLPLS